MDEQLSISNGRTGLTSLLDFGARWFRARAERRETDPLGEHGHWDPVTRDWRYHTHESESRRAS